MPFAGVADDTHMKLPTLRNPKGGLAYGPVDDEIGRCILRAKTLPRDSAAAAQNLERMDLLLAHKRKGETLNSNRSGLDSSEGALGRRVRDSFRILRLR